MVAPIDDVWLEKAENIFVGFCLVGGDAEDPWPLVALRLLDCTADTLWGGSFCFIFEF